MHLHEGQYLDPVMRDMEAFFESSQDKVSGDVIVTLKPYHFSLDGIVSKHDLMDSKFGSYGEENKGWTADEAKGFIKIIGNQNKIYQQVKHIIEDASSWKNLIGLKFTIGNHMKKLEIGIIGGAGYTAGELIRLLLQHPKTNINFIYSTSNAGNKIYKVHQDLIGDTEISFTSEINSEVSSFIFVFRSRELYPLFWQITPFLRKQKSSI